MAQCDSLVDNQKLTGTFDTGGGNKNEFFKGLVPHWKKVLGTPDLVSLAVSSPSAGRVGSWHCNYHEAFYQPPPLPCPTAGLFPPPADPPNSCPLPYH
ncbi:MAG: hypothetical protein HN600_06380 [Bacteroidetes bacterium]|nr:hypothetical protein [Bacteroidota bacterium]